jgi:hypothetical protein
VGDPVAAAGVELQRDPGGTQPRPLWVGLFVGLLLSHRLGPWGIVAGVAVLFFGFFNWVFEKGYSEFTTPSHDAH